jgi:predicted DNA-binding WGR domain protein
MSTKVPNAFYLESSAGDGRRHRYYSISVHGRRVTFRWGRIGRAGDELVIDAQSEEKARALAREKLDEKRRRGYVDAEPGATPSVSVPPRPCSRTLPLPLPEPARAAGGRS